MKALVVYESMFGNTRHIAEAIADGIATVDPHRGRAWLTTQERSISMDVELVVVGAPTHAWGLSRKRTREGAAAGCGQASRSPARVRLGNERRRSRMAARI